MGVDDASQGPVKFGLRCRFRRQRADPAVEALPVLRGPRSMSLARQDVFVHVSQLRLVADLHKTAFWSAQHVFEDSTEGQCQDVVQHNILVHAVQLLSEGIVPEDLELGIVQLWVAERARFSPPADEFVRIPDLQRGASREEPYSSQLAGPRRQQSK